MVGERKLNLLGRLCQAVLAAVQVLDSSVPSWAAPNSIAALGCLMLPSENFSHLLSLSCPSSLSCLAEKRELYFLSAAYHQSCCF